SSPERPLARRRRAASGIRPPCRAAAALRRVSSAAFWTADRGLGYPARTRFAMYAAARKSTPPPADEERISIPGIASRVVARVDRRTNPSVTLTRELPLLRVGTAIEGQGGRSGTIAGVWISMEGDVPALCVEVAYDDDQPKSGRPPAVRGD